MTKQQWLAHMIKARELIQQAEAELSLASRDIWSSGVQSHRAERAERLESDLYAIERLVDKATRDAYLIHGEGRSQEYAVRKTA